MSLFDIITPAFKHLIAMKLYDSNHLKAEAVTEQKSGYYGNDSDFIFNVIKKKRDKRRD